MKSKFNTKWKASKQPRKQRKYLVNTPLHLKRKFLSVNLTKELRKKYGIRNIPIRKGDLVKIMRGKFRKKQGKVTEIKTKLGKIYLEGIQRKKTDGSKINVPLKASNLQIIQLNLEDKKRKLKTSNKEQNKQSKEQKDPKKDSSIKKIQKKTSIKK